VRDEFARRRVEEPPRQGGVQDHVIHLGAHVTSRNFGVGSWEDGRRSRQRSEESAITPEATEPATTSWNRSALPKYSGSPVISRR
jgi:hypothetical protein